jgi:hypothetical protein
VQGQKYVSQRREAGRGGDPRQAKMTTTTQREEGGRKKRGEIKRRKLNRANAPKGHELSPGWLGAV